MKRRAFLERAVVGAAATTLAGPAIAQTGAPVRWRLATSWPKSLDTVYGTVEAMSQRVGQLTDRKFDIQVFAGGEIVQAAGTGTSKKAAEAQAAAAALARIGQMSGARA